MEHEKKQKLEKLKQLNKARIAKQQLIDDLNRKFQIDISNKKFIDFELSNNIHSKVYKRIRENDVRIEKLYYEYENVSNKLEWILNEFKPFEEKPIIFYPSAFGFYFRRCNQLYLEFPIAIVSSIKDCKNLVFKTVHDIFDDIIIVEENLVYGLVISEDEYQNINFEYWKCD